LTLHQRADPGNPASISAPPWDRLNFKEATMRILVKTGLLGLLLILGTSLGIALFNPASAETKKQFKAEEKAERKAFKAEEKGERRTFNSTDPTAAQRRAFNNEERTERQTFKSQEKAEKSTFKAGRSGSGKSHRTSLASGTTYTTGSGRVVQNYRGAGMSSQSYLGSGKIGRSIPKGHGKG
jgi:hypothetical protein